MGVGPWEPLVDVVEEGAGGALRVLDIELGGGEMGRAGGREGTTHAAGVEPDLGVAAADDLGLERELVAVAASVCGAVGEVADAERGVALGDVAADGVEVEGAVGLKVGDEADAVGQPDATRGAAHRWGMGATGHLDMGERGSWWWGGVDRGGGGQRGAGRRSAWRAACGVGGMYSGQAARIGQG